MKRVYVVDEQGATFAFTDQSEAEECYQDEKSRSAVRLVMYSTNAPDEITDLYRLSDWCCSHAEPIEFIHGDRATWAEDLS